MKKITPIRVLNVLNKLLCEFLRSIYHFKPLLFVFSTLLLLNCTNNHYNEPAFSENGMAQMVIEIPAGTNLKYEFNPQSEKFEVEIIDGAKRSVNFLGYPGNYGFIPSTLMDTANGGDGDALDVLLISASLNRGQLIPIIPIAVLKLDDHGENDDKIIAIPAEESLRTINSMSLTDLQNDYPNVEKILKLWFTGYKDGIEFKGWDNEKQAMKVIIQYKK
ncbi:inorganic diphosphatase [Fulvivirga sediminis]|uniref:inorganic diphosphatase n=1 Tax=Fulvivirga sediminis TaxID=2803949 RepID=A0A937FBH4_9BACT|nr:inorganic diphosphatase [Fulvivirga sediminis]MBL3657825.1 inorganic diphosphatase [Fulvivirga sediminis]